MGLGLGLGLGLEMGLELGLGLELRLEFGRGLPPVKKPGTATTTTTLLTSREEAWQAHDAPCWSLLRLHGRQQWAHPTGGARPRRRGPTTAGRGARWAVAVAGRGGGGGGGVQAARAACGVGGCPPAVLVQVVGQPPRWRDCGGGGGVTVGEQPAEANRERGVSSGASSRALELRQGDGARKGLLWRRGEGQRGGRGGRGQHAASGGSVLVDELR